jgi:hypothetical protein
MGDLEYLRFPKKQYSAVLLVNKFLKDLRAEQLEKKLEFSDHLAQTITDLLSGLDLETYRIIIN